MKKPENAPIVAVPTLLAKKNVPFAMLLCTTEKTIINLKIFYC